MSKVGIYLFEGCKGHIKCILGGIYIYIKVGDFE